MKAFVVDASVALKWILLEEHSELALVLLDGSFELHVPNLVFAEFGNTLWKKSVRGELTPPQIDEAIALFQDVPLRVHRDRWLLKNATRIAREKNHPVYDCFYLALAESLETAVVTADRKLVQKIADPTRALFVTDFLQA